MLLEDSMNDKINVTKWGAEVISDICDFISYWESQNKEDPEKYPKSMSRGDWDEQFDSFQYEKE
jgi:hypothetical protein